MDMNQIRELIRAVEASDVDEVRVREDGCEVIVTKHGSSIQSSVSPWPATADDGASRES